MPLCRFWNTIKCDNDAAPGNDVCKPCEEQIRLGKLCKFICQWCGKKYYQRKQRVKCMPRCFEEEQLAMRTRPEWHRKMIEKGVSERERKRAEQWEETASKAGWNDIRPRGKQEN